MRPPSHADIFPHGVVKEIVVLRHERNLVIQLRQRDVLQLVAAHGDAAGAGVPEARGELGNGRCSAAGRADQRRHFGLRYGQADAVEDLLIRMVAEADVFEHDGMVGKCGRRFAVDLLLRVQDLIHLRDRRAYLRQRIHEIERGHAGRGLRNGDQIQHLAFLDPMILVHKLFFSSA